jgi:RNA-directed DNA polymerase
MSPVTPDKIRSLQRKLYCKAKAEPAFRFYVLYDKVCREDILHHAYRVARANAGAPGVDGVTFAQIEEQGLEAWLAGLREELVSKTYRPDPVRRVMIPKPNGEGERALGIPTIRDRVIQTAAKFVLEPIFEADFEDNSYGYRPARGAVDAVKDVHRHLCRGYTDVVDADLSRYFDSIPHDDLLKPIPEALASNRQWRSIPCSCRLLCRRLCHPQPRSCGGGTGLDEGSDDQARADTQRD